MKIKILVEVYNRAKKRQNSNTNTSTHSLLFFIKCACDIGCSKDTRSIYDIIINGLKNWIVEIEQKGCFFKVNFRKFDAKINTLFTSLQRHLSKVCP